MKKKPSKIDHSANLKDYYGRDYVEKFSKHQSLHRLNRLLKHMKLRPSYQVADFACGNGMLMPLVAPKVMSYVGVDFSEEFIRDANERKIRQDINNADFICADISAFCIAHEKVFDCAFAMDFSEHVYDDDWVEILGGIRRSLKINSSLYIHTPNALFIVEQMKKHSFILKQFKEHVAVRSPEENLMLLKKAGFKIVRILLLPHYNAFRFLHFLSYVPVIGKFFEARIFIEAVRESE